MVGQILGWEPFDNQPLLYTLVDIYIYIYWIPISLKNGSILAVQQLGPGTIPRDKNYL